jgi:hypothetical protein
VEEVFGEDDVQDVVVLGWVGAIHKPGKTTTFVTGREVAYVNTGPWLRLLDAD